MRAVEGCLRRLRTDWIDLLQLHVPDPATPIEETLRALDDLVESGKVTYVGYSNFDAWHLVEAGWTARTEHLARPIATQPYFNLLRREPEAEADLQSCPSRGSTGWASSRPPRSSRGS